jgi:hypothetical protein
MLQLCGVYKKANIEYRIMNTRLPCHRVLDKHSHCVMNQMLKFTSHQFQGIAGRSNFEGMYSVYFIKKTEQNETALRKSALMLFAAKTLTPET